MIAEAEIETARRRIDLAELIGRDVVLRRIGREYVGCCPFHSENTPSFTVVAQKGFFHCFGCGAHGNAIDYLMRSRHLDFVTAVQELLGGLPLSAPPAAGSNTPGERQAAAVDISTQQYVEKIIRESGPITPTTAAWLYLWARGLSVDQPALRAHPGLWCVEAKCTYPALIAPVKNSAGQVCAIQRIYLLPVLEPDKPDNRAPVKRRKMSLGHMGDGCVRLAAAAPVMGIAEGVETAIAASMTIGKISVWATLGAGRMAGVWIPEICQRLTIYADRGVSGVAAAERAREAHASRGIACSVAYPEFGQDYNDEDLTATQAVNRTAILAHR